MATKQNDKAPAYTVGALYAFKVRKFTKLAGPPELSFRPGSIYRADGELLNSIGANVDAASVELQEGTLAAALHADPAGDLSA